MNKLNKTMMLLALGLPLFATGAFAETNNLSISLTDENSEACYMQTVAANEGADSSSLSVAACDRVLSSKHLIKRLESATLVNRAIIQSKKADYAGAESSLTRALQVSPGLEKAELLMGQIERRVLSTKQRTVHQTTDAITNHIL